MIFLYKDNKKILKRQKKRPEGRFPFVSPYDCLLEVILQTSIPGATKAEPY